MPRRTARIFSLLVPALLLAGCAAVAPRGRLPVSEYTLKHRAAAEAAARGMAVTFAEDPHDGLRMTLARAPAPAMSWSPDGRDLAVHDGQTIRVHAVHGEGAPRTRSGPQVPRYAALHWLDDGRLWCVGHEGAIASLAPGATDWRDLPAPGGRVRAVRGDGRRVLVQRGGRLRLLAFVDGGWRPLVGFDRPAAHAAFGGETLYLADPRGLHAYDGDGQPLWSRPWSLVPAVRAVHHLAARGEWLSVVVDGRRQLFVDPGDGAVQRARAVPPGTLRAPARDPELPAVLADGARHWLAWPDGAEHALPAGTVRASVSPDGLQVAIARHDGVWLRPLQGGVEGVRLQPLKTSASVAAVVPDPDKDAEEVWVLGLTDAPLPVLATRPPAAARPGPGRLSLGALSRFGLHPGDPVVFSGELAGRLNVGLFGVGGDGPVPERRHQLLLGGQMGLGLEWNGEVWGPALRVAAPLTWHSDIAATWGENTYVGGVPLSLVVEPGLSVGADGVVPELTVSLMSEEYGGGYLRFGYDPGGGRSVGFGVELGRQGTAYVAGAALMGVLIAALASADWVWPDCVHRCGPMWSDDP